MRATLATITGASGARLDALTRRAFQDFAVCFSDLVTTNRRPAEQLLDYVGNVSKSPILEDAIGVVSVTAHVGNWEMGGRLREGKHATAHDVVVAPEAVTGLERWVRRDGGRRAVRRPRASHRRRRTGRGAPAR